MPALRHRRRPAAIVAALTLLLGLGVIVYRGPGRVLVRGALGDVLVVVFLYFALGAMTRWRPRTRLLVVGGVALATELSQLVPRGVRSTAVELTVGTTFDPWDIVCYGIGLALAWLLEARVMRRMEAGSGVHQAGDHAAALAGPESAHRSADHAAHQPAHQPDQ